MVRNNPKDTEVHSSEEKPKVTKVHSGENNPKNTKVHSCEKQCRPRDKRHKEAD